MRILIRLYLFVLILITISCQKKKDTADFGLDCNLLINGLINTNILVIKNQIDKLTLDLSPVPTSTDNLGHQNNFEKLIDRINKCGNLEAVMSCYGCIKTYPVQSEILIKIDSAGKQLRRTIDIKTSVKSNLEFISVH